MSEDPTLTRVRGTRTVADADRLPRGDTGVWASLASIRTFQALQYRNFRYLWLAQISNSASLWMEQVARPVLVLTIVADPQLAAVHVGGVLAARTFPQLGFGMVAGVMADWYDRRMLIFLSKLVGTIINFLFAILVLSGYVELWHLYATTILRGIATSFDNPARQALIPSLVPPEHLTNAVALNSASMQTMRIGAAAIAGLSLVVIGVGGTFLAVAISGAVAVVLTYLMRVPPMPTIKDKSIGSAFTSLWEGLAYAWDTPTIRGVLLLTVAYFALGMAYLQVFAPLFAKQVLGIGDAGFGLMVSVTGIGSLAGSLFIATVSPSRGRGPIMLVLMGALGILLMVFGLSTYLPGMMASPGLEVVSLGGLHLVVPWVAATFLVVIFLGTTQSSYFALSNTVLLEHAPEEKRGRIMGVLALDRSMITLGGTLAGFLSAALGPQLAQILFGAAILIAALSLATLLPSLRKIE
ncbi:MAG: MFS transporter [Chloroflexi bacterium]|nr:MFS transporter [Chloroflexota bacterium]